MLKNPVKLAIKKLFHYGYLYCGRSPYTLSIEVNDSQSLKISTKKVVVVPRRSLFENISEKQLEIINQIFDFKTMVFSKIEHVNRVLILTQPFYEDGVIETEEKQVALYKKIIDQFGGVNKIIYVKPHPRDAINYKDNFPEIIFLEKNIPMEVLDFNFPENTFLWELV